MRNNSISLVNKLLVVLFSIGPSLIVDAQKNALDYFNYGFSQVEQQQYGKAIEYYTQALALDSTMVNAYYNRAVAKIYLEDLPAALEDLNIAITMKPDFAVAFYKRGLVKYNLKKREDGCHDIDNARILGWDEAEQTYKDYCW